MSTSEKSIIVKYDVIKMNLQGNENDMIRIKPADMDLHCLQIMMLLCADADKDKGIKDKLKNI